MARFDGATLHLPYDADRLAAAPLHDPDTLISYAEGDDLARHYGLLPPEPVTTGPTGTGPVEAEPDPSGTPESATTIRSEERLRTGAVNVVVGRARLVTYVLTEDQTFTVPVRRQEVRLIYDAVPEDDQVVSDVDPAEQVHEIVLHTEQVLFSTRVVPVERVRLVRRVVTGERTVTEQVRAEQVRAEQVRAEQVDVEHYHADSGGHDTDHARTGRHHDHQER